MKKIYITLTKRSTTHINIKKLNFQSKFEKKRYSNLNNKLTKIKMPSLSPTMKTGEIEKWLVKEGDKVVIGDLLAEIKSDKAIVSINSNQSKLPIF
jgi:hypothetical protein